VVGEGGAAKFSIHSGVQGGVVHASYALHEAAVEDFKVVEGGDCTRGKGPGFTCIWKDGGDQRVKELAHNAGGVNLVFCTPTVEGVESAFSSGKEVGGGRTDASAAVEDNA
jgi:hypothetical protein